MMFCLDDGAELLYGPRSEPPASAGGFLQHDDEPQTAILSEPSASAGAFRLGPTFDPIRDDPRYKDLIKRMNLPE